MDGERGMNVTIFFPPIPQGNWDFKLFPNLGSAYLDAAIRDKFNVSVVDANILHEPTAEFYKDYNEEHYGKENVRKIWQGILNKLVRITENTNPDVLGLSSWSYNMPFIAEFSRLFRARNPDVIMILGGITPTLVPNETMQTLPYIDYYVRGEGEYTLLELLQKLKANEKINDVKGISFWKGSKIRHTPDRPFIKDLDKLSLMDYENFIGFESWNRKNKLDFIQVMTSRGCVARCSFCSVYNFWSSQRYYSNEYIVKQIRHLYDLYDFNDLIAYMDDNFVVSFMKTKKLIEHVKRHFPFNWQIVDMRVDVLSSEFIKWSVKNKCEFMGFGVESLNGESLRYMNKTLTPEQYRKQTFDLLDLTEKLKIRTMLSGIIGAPNESKQDILNEVNFYIKVYNEYLYSKFDVAPITIHPGSDLWSKYLRGEIKVYKRERGWAKRFYEGMFADDWDHLLFMVPNSYRIPNEKMGKEEFEALLKYVLRDVLFNLNEIIVKGLEREKFNYLTEDSVRGVVENGR